ncbi:hypothetical protein CHS0354_034473 [Potamilus streckersoni]|uniref:Uncharacterized protein n=1 Tax=Potamilus streckersoni TaxID=2493646 RepID=A0AAE0VGB2_9BIVA|nr:hypothetical protein CHS0354_034473 [Potamilus streckersoni]
MDVTSRIQKYKRNVGESDFPDDLTFYLSRGTQSMYINLKRNHGINPNAEVFFVRTLEDGRTHLEKTPNIENERDITDETEKGMQNARDEITVTCAISDLCYKKGNELMRE